MQSGRILRSASGLQSRYQQRSGNRRSIKMMGASLKEMDCAGDAKKIYPTANLRMAAFQTDNMMSRYVGGIMVKPKIVGETKEERFKRIATARTRRILEDFRLLGNCANRGTYSYAPEDINRIFATIEKEWRRVKALFSKPKVEFSLG